MARGEPHVDTYIGQPEDWPVLAPLLERRALMLLEWADDVSLWDDIEDREDL
jgi:hypothetical protein